MADGHDGMDRGTARAHSNPQIAPELTHARSDPSDTDPGPERPTLLVLRRAADVATIVGDDQMQAPGDASQVD